MSRVRPTTVLTALLLAGCSAAPTASPPEPSASVASPAEPTSSSPGSSGDRVVVQVAAGPVGLTRDGRGGAWVVSARGETLTHLAHDGEVLAEHPLPGVPLRLTRAYGALWVTLVEDGTVVRVEERTGQVTRTIRVGEGPEAITAAHGRLWVVAQDAGELVEVDPRAGRVTRIP